MEVSTSEVLLGQAAPTQVTFRNQLVGLVCLHHVGMTLLFLPIVFGTMALAGVRFNDPRLALVSIVAVISSLGVNVVNDLVDVERDKQKWPLRPLPSGLLPRSWATTSVIIVGTATVAVAMVWFNWLFAALAVSGFVLVYAYARYTRDNVGHLTGAFFGGLVPVVLWAAIFPAAILTAVPWLLYIGAVTQNAALNFVNESFDPEVKSFFFTRFKPTTDAMLYVASIIGSFLVGTVIFFYAQLAWPYLLVLGGLTVFVLLPTRDLIKEERSQELAKKTFGALSMYMCIYWLALAVFVWIK